MHSSVESAEKIPAFLYKLWKLVEDENTDHLIRWGEDGKSFLLCSQGQFSRELLPLYYKHNNMASFVRQLNMYGFRKVPSMEGGGLRLDRDEMEFAHPYFVRGEEHNLELIKRKMSTRMPGGGAMAMEDPRLTDVMTEVVALRQKQESVMTQINTLKQENQIVWAKYSQLHDKFNKQQNIINKLMRFLMSMMKTTQLSRTARKLPHLANPALYTTAHNIMPALTHGTSPLSDGPVIHEVVDELPDIGVVPNQVLKTTSGNSRISSSSTSSNNVVLHAAPATTQVIRMMPQTVPDASLLDSTATGITIPNDQVLSAGSANQRFMLSPRGVILNTDGTPVDTDLLLNEPSYEPYTSPQPIVESPKGTILSSVNGQSANIKTERLQDVAEIGVAIPQNNRLVTSSSPQVVIGNGSNITSTNLEVKPKIISVVRSTKDGTGVGRGTVTYTLRPNSTLIRNTPVSNLAPATVPDSSGLNTFNTPVVVSGGVGLKQDMPNARSDRTQNVITNVTVIPADSAPRISNPIKVPDKVLTTNNNAAGMSKKFKGKESSMQTLPGPYILTRTIGNKNTPSNSSNSAGGVVGQTIPTNSAVKRSVGGASVSMAGRRSTVKDLGEESNRTEDVPLFKVVRKNPVPQQQQQQKDTEVENTLATALNAAVSTPTHTNEVTDVVPAHNNVCRDTSGLETMSQLAPSDSLDLILANDETSIAIPSEAAAGSSCLSPRDQVMKDLDEMQVTVDNLQEYFKQGNIPCEPQLFNRIFNPDLPFSDLDFMTDIDLLSSMYEMSGGNDASNGQQLSVYNPNTSVDLTELVDSPTENDDLPEESFAMATLDPDLINTPKVDM
ncbi:uncharacterized protein LOC108683062 isoform X2 [Hyalella azteca]|uniref:Uncharacterized protein LOC108683062 isoform X2 n=1 Tax=Hyalella azteca TaxID=294128 RepID=A0A8B7PNP6_HYAAZ|nr:uncharacterized protein LOC108683062 isoform X2 [Hyalella azteca]